jgi:hypothetical protein
MWLAVRDGAHLSDGWAQKLAHSGFVLFVIGSPAQFRDRFRSVGSGNSGTLIPEILARSVPAGKISSRLR